MPVVVAADLGTVRQSLGTSGIVSGRCSLNRTYLPASWRAAGLCPATVPRSARYVGPRRDVGGMGSASCADRAAWTDVRQKSADGENMPCVRPFQHHGPRVMSSALRGDYSASRGYIRRTSRFSRGHVELPSRRLVVLDPLDHHRDHVLDERAPLGALWFRAATRRTILPRNREAGPDDDPPAGLPFSSVTFFAWKSNLISVLPLFAGVTACFSSDADGNHPDRMFH